MKKYILLCLTALAVIACEDVQDNSPAFQANLDNDFYKAIDTRGVVAEDGTVALIGATTDQNITLNLSGAHSGIFELNDANGHQATFQDATGRLYSTEFGGSGVVEITGHNGSEQLLSGTFKFDAILPGVDTVTVSKGVLYLVPYASGVIEDPTDPTDPSMDGAFVAEIDGELFDPSTVVATTTDTFINISGALGDDTIQIIIPLDAEPSTQAIPGGGFNAIYFIAGVEESAVSGTIRVFEHDMTARTISGTFSFATENHTISLGQYNINY